MLWVEGFKSRLILLAVTYSSWRGVFGKREVVLLCEGFQVPGSTDLEPSDLMIFFCTAEEGDLPEDHLNAPTLLKKFESDRKL